MRGKSYVKNAALLTVTGLILRAAGMMFRVFIAARIGASGMGLYQLIITVYGLFVTFATAGLPAVAARIVSGLAAQGDLGGLRPSARRMMLLASGIGLLGSAALFFGARAAAALVIGDERAALSLRILAPSLPFMAASAVVRGCFLALREVGPNARAQMFEQLLRIGFVALLLTRISPDDTALCCAAVVLGNTVSEAASWVYMFLSWRRRVRCAPPGGRAVPVRGLAKLLGPIAASQYLTSALHTVENVLVPARLASFLTGRDEALAQYGALKGMALPVLFFPFSFLSTLSTLLQPEITRAYLRKDTARLRTLTARTLRITLGISVLAGGLFTVYAYEIGRILYRSEEIGFYISVLGPLMPLMYLESMVDGLLKGLDRQIATFRYTVVDSAARIFLIVVLLPLFGMKGFLFVMLVSNLLTSLLNLSALLRVTGVRFRAASWLGVPALCAVCSTFAVRVAAAPLLAAVPSLFIRTCLGGALFSVVHAVMMAATGGLRFADFRSGTRPAPDEKKDETFFEKGVDNSGFRW